MRLIYKIEKHIHPEVLVPWPSSAGTSKEEITVQKFGAMTRIGRYLLPDPEMERKEHHEKYLDGGRQVFYSLSSTPIVSQ